MESSSITSWQIEGEKVEVVTDFLFLGSKITVDSDHSYEIRRQLLLGRKVMRNLGSVLKSGDITLPTKVCIVKAMVFPVVTFCYESCTIKKAECQRIDAFKLWCWRRLLNVPWTTGRTKQSILRDMNSEYSLEGLMLKLKLQYFDHLIQTEASLEKSLLLGKTKGRRRRQCQKMRCNKHKFRQTLGGGEIQGHLACCSPWGHKELHTTGQLNNTGMCQIELEQKRMSSKGDRLCIYIFF